MNDYYHSATQLPFTP